MSIQVHLDGIEHLNIYSKAKTSLGQALTNMCLFTFEYKGLTFHSVEQAWHYFKFLNKNKEVAKTVLEMSNPFLIKKYVKPYNNEFTAHYVQSAEFQSIIKDVILSRIKQDPTLSLNLRNSTLPFAHYYTFGDNSSGFTVIDESDKYQWLIDIFTDIRLQLWFEYLDSLLLNYGGVCYNKATAPIDATYVGRGSHFQLITYGNPFPVSPEIKQQKKVNRVIFDNAVALSVMQFRSYLIQELRKNPKVWYKALQSLRGKTLQCFCNNGSTSRLLGGGFCHSLILASFAENVDEIFIQLGLISNGSFNKHTT